VLLGEVTSVREGCISHVVEETSSDSLAFRSFSNFFCPGILPLPLLFSIHLSSSFAIRSQSGRAEVV